MSYTDKILLFLNLWNFHLSFLQMFNGIESMCSAILIT